MMAFWRSYAHLVWTTKNRTPLIGPEIEAALYACLVAKAAELGCYVYAVNGISDHVHLVISIPPKHSVSWVVKNLKGNSSHFVNHELTARSESFAWQRGYGYLSLGESQLARAVAYVENQKSHHAQMNTNRWLEMTDDETDDQNPTLPSHVIRESGIEYGLDDLFF